MEEIINYGNTDEKILVQRLKEKDKEAFNELIRIYGPRLLRSARLLTLSESSAEELVSDTFTEVFLSLQRYRGESALFTWIYSIMLNQFRYRLRQQKRYMPLDVHPEIEAPANDEQIDSYNQIPEWLSQLSAEHRTVLVLKYLEGKKIEEIALLLQVPTGTVKSRIYNALENLRGIIPRSPMADSG